MAEQTFAGGGYVTPPSLPGITTTPESPTSGIPLPRDPVHPDPFYVEGLRGAIQMFAPIDGTQEMDREQDALWWGNVTRYADAMAAYLRTRSRESR